MGNFVNKLSNYQVIPRELIFDNTLSDRARFLYCYMASKPNDWEFYMTPMAKEIGYSVETLRKYLNELIENGWLVKGEQKNEGVFGAVIYTLNCSKTPNNINTDTGENEGKASDGTKNTDTEKIRLGEIPTQHNIDALQSRDDRTEEEEKDKSFSKKDELFEECWKAYRRKGKKGKAKTYWNKLKEDERGRVLQHIKAYVSSRDVNYQQDFERYLRDKTFESIVFRGNNIVYDPTLDTSADYHPFGNNNIMWNDIYKCWLSIDYFDGSVIDGYNDDNRPDGAEIVLHNGRGTITWSKKDKKWNIEMKSPWK